jgi:hypothetical protein
LFSILDNDVSIYDEARVSGISAVMSCPPIRPKNSAKPSASNVNTMRIPQISSNLSKLFIPTTKAITILKPRSVTPMIFFSNRKRDFAFLNRSRAAKIPLAMAMRTTNGRSSDNPTAVTMLISSKKSEVTALNIVNNRIVGMNASGKCTAMECIWSLSIFRRFSSIISLKSSKAVVGAPQTGHFPLSFDSSMMNPHTLHFFNPDIE